LPDLRTRRLFWTVLALLLLALVGRDFGLATTFLGDDHIFRAFARLERNPLVSFVSDKHGGEYYRPVPMVLWWLLERIGGGRRWPFALSAFLLHASCAGLLSLVARRLGVSRATSALAGALFLAAPAQREAALWFSASTDLAAAAAMLGSLACLLSKGRAAGIVAVVLAGVAFFSKETALVLPLLVASIGWYCRGAEIRRKIGMALVFYCVLAVAYLAVRTWILRGVGGAADPRAPWWALAVQLASGWVHAVTCYAPLPEWAAWSLGGAALLGTGYTLRRSRPAALAALWALLAVLPLPAAGWVVGARYFYFCAAGLMLLVALALERAGRWLAVILLAGELGLGWVAADKRAGEVRLYRQVVAAARDAVSAGVTKGHRLFLVRGSVKDLDLAIKLDPRSPAAVREAVAIPDVPASFVWVPHAQAERLRFLFANPCLPPSGAYRFGDERIVGLARREEAPDLDEVLAKLPDLRIIRLRLDAHPVAWEDRTADYLAK